MAGTVTVACKQPNGLILKVYDFQDVPQEVLGGGIRDLKVAVQRGEDVRIRGTRREVGGRPPILHGDYALTSNVDADFWTAWLAQNKGGYLVKNNVLFAMPKEDDAARRSKEQASVKSGLEPMPTDRAGIRKRMGGVRPELEVGVG